LRELGYDYGRNLVFVQRSARGDPSRLEELAQELVREEPEVIVTGFGALAARAARAATTRIPIVFTALGAPVAAGIIGDLAHPESNVTGLTDQAAELKGKQLELLQEVVPNDPVAVVVNPTGPYGAIALRQLQVAAERRSVQLIVLQLSSPDELTPAKMEALVEKGARSVVIVEDALTNDIRYVLLSECVRLRLPTIAGQRQYAVDGALMTYGADRIERFRRAAEYVDRILKGASPADLPVEDPTRFRLVINLQTATGMGLAIPPTLLARADEVIE